MDDRAREMIMDQIKQDAERLHLLVNGDENTEVHLEGKVVGSIQKQIKDAVERLNNGG